ncbi:hypothetical protein QBC46DRAFT_383831 [Diplogelasinospora grovesii]|uniref:Uncharacterized protein n=1 Tax=Diplogelasinospora grovesii TaxID=303347 RepID=A0AAN6NB31_9PEZI|nr:hypothetical protein QBC46DRAFT_383831 [Diplogelasinospora grovesii]
MSDSKKPLRQLAAEKIHGKGANPSQLGDPVSLKAETSATIRSTAPTPDDTDDPGMPKTVRTPPPSSGGSHEEKKLKGGHFVRGMMTDNIRQGQAKNLAQKKGKTLEGDATSLKAETTIGQDPVDHDNGPSGSRGAGQRKSKL